VTRSPTGIRGNPPACPRPVAAVDADGRYPDVLARAPSGSARPLSVINAAISGNKVLRDGADGGNFDTYGPSH